MEPTIVIEQLTSYNTTDANALRHLAQQIGTNYQTLTDEAIQEMLASDMHFLYVARRDDTHAIVGMLLLLVYRIPYVKKAYLEDLVVDRDYRNKGIATKLFSEVLGIARQKGAAYVDFTSRAERGASIGLYEKFGFQKRDTNVYRVVFTYGQK